MSVRRRRNDSSGVNLDSLMDTLTNVVGILIIILILVQINVSQAVKKIVSDLPPVTLEEHAKLKADAAAIAAHRESLRDAQTNDARNKAELDKANAEFALLEAQRPTDVKLVDLATLQAQLEEKRKLNALQKEEMAGMLAESDRMKALLASTPVPRAIAQPPAKLVKIPSSRPVPDKARFVHVIITKGQIFVLDVEGAEQMVMREFNSVKQTMVSEKKKDAAGKTVYIYDQQKVVDFLAKRALSLRNATIAVPINKPWTRLPMKLTVSPGRGEPPEVARRLTSQFSATLQKMKGTNAVVWFHVLPDSFESYLQAREITDAAGIPAGWEVAGEPAFAIALNDFDVAPLEAPPVAVPDAQVPIDPPKKTLD